MSGRVGRTWKSWKTFSNGNLTGSSCGYTIQYRVQEEDKEDKI